MNKSILKDINKYYIEAVKYYEDELNEIPNIESFINLAFIYWSFACEQMEFNIPNKITNKWSLIGGKRFSIIIDRGLINYPDNLELNFWKLYFPHRLYLTEFSETDCKALLKKYTNESLVPYFYLFLFDKTNYKDEIQALLNICNDIPTAKNLYIKTFLNSKNS